MRLASCCFQPLEVPVPPPSPAVRLAVNPAVTTTESRTIDVKGRHGYQFLAGREGIRKKALTKIANPPPRREDRPSARNLAE